MSRLLLVLFAAALPACSVATNPICLVHCEASSPAIPASAPQGAKP